MQLETDRKKIKDKDNLAYDKGVEQNTAKKKLTILTIKHKTYFWNTQRDTRVVNTGPFRQVILSE